jgi:hypothetical protein
VVAGVATIVADFPAGVRRRRRRFSRRRFPSGHADLAGEPRVSRRSSWTSSPPPAGRSCRRRAGRPLPPWSWLAQATGQAGLPCGSRGPVVSCLGQVNLGVKN